MVSGGQLRKIGGIERIRGLSRSSRAVALNIVMMAGQLVGLGLWMGANVK